MESATRLSAINGLAARAQGSVLASCFSSLRAALSPYHCFAGILYRILITTLCILLTVVSAYKCGPIAILDLGIDSIDVDGRPAGATADRE